jgi:hypothetical protein
VARTESDPAYSSIVDIDDVWQLIDRARAELGDEAEDTDEVAARMVARLSRRDPADIVAFAQPLDDLMARSYTVELWAAAYLINGGASDDGFDYFRGWLIGQGRSVFERAVADPDSLADHPVVAEAAEDLEAEDILGVAWNAYQIATGEQLPAGSAISNYPSIDLNWDFDDKDEMTRRLPKLSAIYPYDD